MTSRQRKMRLAVLLPLAWIFWKQLQLTPSREHSSGPSNSGTGTLRPSSSYAYASLIGGIDPDNPSYRGFLYNVIIASRLLRQSGSKADFVLFVQLSHSSPAQELSHQDLRLLKACQIGLQYIPKSLYQGFYEITLEKFRVLQLMQYRRVLFMDADVMPLGNLDYLFDMTDGVVLKENLVVAGTQEPSTAGFFLLSTGPGKWQELQRVIQAREQQAQHLESANKFDIVKGWGHAIQPPDRWETLVRDKSGTEWTFYSADADQGLLYEWVKYNQQSVSIVLGSIVQNWVPGSNNYPTLETVLQRPFKNLTKSAGRIKPRVAKWAKGPPPYCHFYHFTGRSKPWEQPQPTAMDLATVAATDARHMASPTSFWFYHLDLANKELGLFEDWELERAKISKPPLGRFHVKSDIAQRVNRTNNQPSIVSSDR